MYFVDLGYYKYMSNPVSCKKLNPRKFEVSTFTHYEDTKSNAKYRNWGGFGDLDHSGSSATSVREYVFCVFFQISKNMTFYVFLK